MLFFIEIYFLLRKIIVYFCFLEKNERKNCKSLYILCYLVLYVYVLIIKLFSCFVDKLFMLYIYFIILKVKFM